MITKYAKSIGLIEMDAGTARNIQLSVADCRHIKHMLQQRNAALQSKALDAHHSEIDRDIIRWNDQLIEYLRWAV